MADAKQGRKINEGRERERERKIGFGFGSCVRK